MSNASPIRVLILHRDPVARAGLSVACGMYSDLEVLGASAPLDGETSLTLLQRHFASEVIVADYLTGVALARQVALHARSPGSPKVIVIAGVDREWEIRTALGEGVRGYFLVGCALDELAIGIRLVHRGTRYLSPEVAARLAESVSLEALTAREEDVLRLLVEGLSNKAIGRQLAIAVGTVKSHLKSAFDKLDVVSRTQASAVVQRRGLLRQPRRSAQGDDAAQLTESRARADRVLAG